jgi:membrane protein YdbS with pleckstrin-like domain
MALIKCPECGREVSSSAPTCPACGYPVAAQPSAQPAPVASSNELLDEVRPSWWRYFWHLFFFWLIVPPIIAWWQRASVVLRVYPGRLMLERGIFSKCYREFLARDIRSIDIDQSFLQRMVGIGDLSISTAATVDAAEKINGIPGPHELRDLILAQRGGS